LVRNFNLLGLGELILKKLTEEVRIEIARILDSKNYSGNLHMAEDILKVISSISREQQILAIKFILEKSYYDAPANGLGGGSPSVRDFGFF
jgi:hypothetical protein